MTKKYFTDVASMTASYTEKHIIYCRKISDGIHSICRKDTGSADTLNALAGMYGHCERLLASDIEARRVIGEKLGQLLCDVRRKLPLTKRLYFITLISDLGVTSDRSPVVYVKEYENKARRALTSANMNAVIILEPHSLPNQPGGGKGGSLILSAHCIAWAKDDSSRKDIISKLEGSSWQCELGARPVDVKRIRGGDINILSVSNYVVKLPVGAKNMVPSRKKPGTFRFRDTIVGNRPSVALRLMEVLSQIDMLDLISGVGEGSKIRQDLRAHVTKWHRDRRRGPNFIPADFDIWRFWLNLRQGAGSKNYLPVRINTPMPQKPKPEKPLRWPTRKRFKIAPKSKIVALAPSGKQRLRARPKKHKVTAKPPFASWKAEKARRASFMRSIRDKRK